MLLDELKKENMIALKEKDTCKRGILSVVIGKCVTLKTDKAIIDKGGLTDEDIIKVISKTLKELEEERKGYESAGNEARSKDITYQIEFIQNYLPKMLSNDEIKCIILTLEDKSVPSVMKHFKMNYGGKVDMGSVSKVLRELN